MKTQYIQPEIAFVMATTQTLLAGSNRSNPGMRHGNAKDWTPDEDSWDFDESDDGGWPTEVREW